MYGAGVYAYDTTPDPTTGGLMFNGPKRTDLQYAHDQSDRGESLGYNGRQLQRHLSRADALSASTGGLWGPTPTFHVYVSHYKSGSGFSNDINRLTEASEIRADCRRARRQFPHYLYRRSQSLRLQAMSSRIKF